MNHAQAQVLLRDFGPAALSQGRSRIELMFDPPSRRLQKLERTLVAGWAGEDSVAAWWLALLAQFDGYQGVFGFGSCARWLSRRCALRGSEARALVAVARRLDELPLVAEALDEGRVSYRQVRALCRVATVPSQHYLVDVAVHLDEADLESVIAGYEAAHRRNTPGDIEEGDASADDRVAADGPVPGRSRLLVRVLGTRRVVLGDIAPGRSRLSCPSRGPPPRPHRRSGRRPGRDNAVARATGPSTRPEISDRVPAPWSSE